jgi:hypothetical protein
MKKITYRWQEGVNFQVPAEIVGNIVSDIQQREGKCRPIDLVNMARSENSPIHALFEWDDFKAAEESRKETARTVLRSYVIVKWSSPKKKKQTFNVHVPLSTKKEVEEERKDPAGYVTMVSVMDNPEARDRLAQTVLQSLIGWRKRYKSLTELDEIWKAIDRIAQRREKEKLLMNDKAVLKFKVGVEEGPEISVSV